MNNILELRGNRFIQAPKSNSGGGIAMNSEKTVDIIHLLELKKQILAVKQFWIGEEIKLFNGALISVYYNKIAAKSNRIAALLKGANSNDAIVGAKFNNKKNKHIITYYVKLKDLDKSISLLEQAKKILENQFGGELNKQTFEDTRVVNKNKFKDTTLSMSKFKQVIADASYIESFGIEEIERKPEKSIITLYDVKQNVQDLLKKIGINPLQVKVLNDQTVYLDEINAQILFAKAPYLVSMSTVDINNISLDEGLNKNQNNEKIKIPLPLAEQPTPTIGVIDTLFDTNVYFSEWVDYRDMINKNIPRESDDYKHGTEVASIIVDGPRLNPWLDDGCGRFKVRLFGVSLNNKFSCSSVIKKIKEIIWKNPDIKVWNVSLGSNEEIDDNFISAFGSLLDTIQYKNDVMFVVAGTNKPNKNIVKIGPPADSINSLVVNSVTISKKPTNYSREGIVLSFFSKPDVSYYGGSEEKYIRVCSVDGDIKEVSGTSYAAPWIARKLSYLIDILGFNREVAKALIIDAARGWNNNLTFEEIALFGHGVVPIHIDNIIHTEKDEIKFLVSDISEKWNTYNYKFPVPLVDNKYPYVARATMCYFPVCNRLQGVDYTNTELNIHFGRINDKGKVVDIKGDRQNQDDVIDEKNFYLLEAEARRQFRKWDNVKYVVEDIEKKVRPRKSYKNKNWGMEIKTNNRLNYKDGQGLRFGVVVTLKAMDGVNRIDEFINNCFLNGWLVNVVDINNRIKIYHTAQEKIEFD